MRFCSAINRLSNSKAVLTINDSTNLPFINAAIYKRSDMLCRIENDKVTTVTPAAIKKSKDDQFVQQKRRVGLPLEFLDAKIKKEIIDQDKSSNVEMLFAGRSNAGKSSLLNNMIGKNLVSTSKAPGKTRNLHFIYNNELGLTLVDSPGYGYASRSEKERNSWERMMQDYIEKSKVLKKIFILIDSETGISELDEGCASLAKFKSIEPVFIFTKCDKIKNKEGYLIRLNEVKKLITKVPTTSNYVFFTSVKQNIGLDELKCFIVYCLTNSSNKR